MPKTNAGQQGHDIKPNAVLSSQHDLVIDTTLYKAARELIKFKFMWYGTIIAEGGLPIAGKIIGKIPGPVFKITEGMLKEKGFGAIAFDVVKDFGIKELGKKAIVAIWEGGVAVTTAAGACFFTLLPRPLSEVAMPGSTVPYYPNDVPVQFNFVPTAFAAVPPPLAHNFLQYNGIGGLGNGPWQPSYLPYNNSKVYNPSVSVDVSPALTVAPASSAASTAASSPIANPSAVQLVPYSTPVALAPFRYAQHNLLDNLPVMLEVHADSSGFSVVAGITAPLTAITGLVGALIGAVGFSIIYIFDSLRDEDYRYLREYIHDAYEKILIRDVINSQLKPLNKKFNEALFDQDMTKMAEVLARIPHLENHIITEKIAKDLQNRKDDIEDHLTSASKKDRKAAKEFLDVIAQRLNNIANDFLLPKKIIGQAAIELYRNSNPQDCLNILETLNGDAKNLPEALMVKCDAYLKLGMFDAAETCLGFCADGDREKMQQEINLRKQQQAQRITIEEIDASAKTPVSASPSDNPDPIVDPTIEKTLKAAKQHADNNSLQQAIDEMKPLAAIFPEIIAEWKAELCMQYTRPIMRFFASVASDNLNRENIAWGEYAVRSLLTIYQIHPDAIPSLANWCLSNDPHQCAAFANVLIRPFNDWQSFGILASGVVTALNSWQVKIPTDINAVASASYGVIACSQVYQNQYTMVGGLAAGFVTSYAIAPLYKQYLLNSAAPQTVWQCLAYDVAMRLPQTLVALYTLPSNPLRGVTLFCESVLTLVRIRWKTYEDQAKQGAVENARAALQKGNVDEALKLYQLHPSHKTDEHEFVRQTAANKVLTSEYKISLEDKVDHVDAIAAMCVLQKKLSAGESKDLSAPARNSYFEYAKKTVEIKLENDGVLIKLAYIEACYALILANNLFFNAAAEYIAKAIGHAEHAAKNEKTQQGYISYAVEKLQFWLPAKQDSAFMSGLKNRSKEINEILLNFTNGESTHGFAQFIYQLYKIRKDKTAEDKNLEHEKLLVIVISQYYAQKIIFVDQSFNTAQIIDILSGILAETKNPGLWKLTVYLLSLILSTKNNAKDEKQHPAYVKSRQYINGINISGLHSEELDLFHEAQYFCLGKSGPEKNKKVAAVVEKIIESAQCRDYLSEIKAGVIVDNNRCSLVINFINAMLAFGVLYGSDNLHPRIKQYKAQIIDSILLRGYLPPLEKMQSLNPETKQLQPQRSMSVAGSPLHAGRSTQIVPVVSSEHKAETSGLRHRNKPG